MKHKGLEYIELEEKVKIYLYGKIRKLYAWDIEGEATDFISSEGVKSLLDKFIDKDIELHINSPGGDVFESIAIHNMLKQHPKKIEVYIDALAGSGASIVAMAANHIYMPKTSLMMIHKAQSLALGNADDFRKTADDLDKIDTVVLESYKERFIGTEDELKKLIANSTWITANEALAFNLADSVISLDSQDYEDNETVERSNVKNLFDKYVSVAVETDKEQMCKQNLLDMLRGE